MAGLIAALFGGKSRPPDPEPVPGLGGYSQPAGPDGASGFPGSTSRTRTFPGNNPRGVTGDSTTIKADTNYGFDQGLTSTVQVRQASFRGDVPGSTIRNPRLTPSVATPQPLATQRMQGNNPTELYGGQPLKTRQGNRNVGQNPLSGAAAEGGHSVRETETPPVQRQVEIGIDTPGAQNVRNTIAERYKNRPGQMHTYLSAPRADTAPVNPGGQATDGNVHPSAVVDSVTVPSRFTWEDSTGSQTWGMLRQMPYTGRGNGARGADLNGQRYYAEGQSDQFWNAGQGDFGIERLRGSGNKRPVAFTEPAPWTQNFYDTTDTVGTTDQPGQPTQAPDMV